MTAAYNQLHTRRLLLQAPDATSGSAQVAAVADFYRRNSSHFAPWDPPLPPDHAAPDRVAQALVDSAEAFAAGRALRWWLLPADDPGRVIGQVHLSALARGAFQSCNLGYALDAGCQGQGLMHEALRAVVGEAFSPRLNLHRMQAAVRPENHRSLALLARLGFSEIGLARHYLFIDGGWRDHRLFDLANPGFVWPADW
ncbi:MAG: GNAT family N-acetyltransferase [Aquabacterium sp.]|nr:GNAT family N-acetyltransferase [Aquabacterium sp.]